jgi:two-component system response regulator ResD
MAMTEVRTPPARVLIIEDDTTTLQFFEQMLVELGYVVSAVSTVEAGLTEADAHRPDAVLLDLHLPLTDGLECLRRLRAAPQSRPMPVAILTGDYFMDDEVARELAELGARIHFKPVWEDDLHRIVEGLVARAEERH